MLLSKEELQNIFIEKFGTSKEKIRFFQAPARINIIGEHVDYLGGLVFPAAINFYSRVAIRTRKDNHFALYSVRYRAMEKFAEIQLSKKNFWANYIKGVISEIQTQGFQISGFDLIVDGNILQGAGLSSSASLEVVTTFAISEIFNLKISKEKIAVIGQMAENHFVGVKCGIMDQFIISVGRENNCILLNTGSLEYSYHPLDLSHFSWTLINSKISHSLKDSGYNTRREECESALRKVQSIQPEIKNLYELDEIDLENFALTPEEKNRVSHVVGEKRRTNDIVKFLQSGDGISVGKILYEAHESLSKLFEVSCNEIDFIVEFLKKEKISGARMIGGGFGGCVLVLSENNHIESVQERLSLAYKKKFGIDLDFLQFKISDGVKEF